MASWPPVAPRTSTRILFFPCGGLNNACARTRLYAYLPFLAAFGLRWHLASYTWHKYDRNGGHPRRTLLSKVWLELLPLRTLAYFFRADTLFFQKREIHKVYAWAGKRLGKRIVYDIDDAIYLETPEALADDEPHRIVTNAAVRAEIEWILARCDLALVSGDELARFCLQYTRHVRILPSVLSLPVFPSVSDSPRFDPPPFTGGLGGVEQGGVESGIPTSPASAVIPEAASPSGVYGRRGQKSSETQTPPKSGLRPSSLIPQPSSLQRPVIGWVGAPENQRYLREIEQVLARLQGEIPDLEVWIVTSREMDPPPSFRYRYIPWSREAEVTAIPQFTVGIAPLADDPWCRAKMNYKALVYMGYGVPAVVTPVGFPVEEFADGQSVLLARTNDDWYRQLKQALTDPARRAAIAAEASAVVRSRFSAPSRAAEFAAALQR